MDNKDTAQSQEEMENFAERLVELLPVVHKVTDLLEQEVRGPSDAGIVVMLTAAYLINELRRPEISLEEARNSLISVLVMASEMGEYRPEDNPIN